MNREECRRQRSWPVSENHPGIFVEALRTTKAIPRIVGVPTGTRTGYLTDANQKGSCLQQLTLQHHINFLRPTGHYMYRPVVTICTTSLTFNNCTFCPHCIYLFCVYLRTNSDLCHLQHKLIGFYNRDEKCLQRGTDWGFK